MCKCGREPETVGHFMLRCSRWAEELATMWNVVGRWIVRCTPTENPDREKWRPDLAAVAAVIQFVKDTDSFEEEAQERA